MRPASLPGVPARKINLLNGGPDATRRLGPPAGGHCTVGKDAEAAGNAARRSFRRDVYVAFVEARGGTVAFLSMLPPSAGERSAQHAEIGKFTLSEMLHEWANHDLGHLRQIAELFRAREFYLYAGSFQKYSNPKP